LHLLENENEGREKMKNMYIFFVDWKKDDVVLLFIFATEFVF